jgi:hypothetical protein
VIIPGHSFQFMLTIAAYLACPASIRRCLAYNGRCIVHIDHQDPIWLGGLPTGPKARSAMHPSHAYGWARVRDRETMVA